MKSSIDVALFALGSDQLDIWRKEINQVVRTILGLARELYWNNPPGEDHYEIACGDNFKWDIHLVSHSALTFQTIRFLHRPDVWRVYYSTDEREVPALPLEQVKIVHDRLSELLSGMLDRFPLLALKMKYFMEAAEVAEARVG